MDKFRILNSLQGKMSNAELVHKIVSCLSEEEALRVFSELRRDHGVDVALPDATDGPRKFSRQVTSREFEQLLELPEEAVPRHIYGLNANCYDGRLDEAALLKEVEQAKN